MSREAHGALCSKQPNCWWVALNQLACDITCFASVSAGRRFASIPRQAKAAPHKSSRFLIIMPARPSTRAEMAYQSGQAGERQGSRHKQCVATRFYQVAGPLGLVATA